MAKIEPDIIDQALDVCKRAFGFVFVFSFACNILMLALPIFSLQVLDRVISSGSMETLFMLSVVATGMFVFLGLFQAVRSMGLIKIGEWFDRRLGGQLLGITISMAALKAGVSGSQSLRDLNTLKMFIAGQGIIALFDAPWSIVFIVVIFMIHPIPGMIAVAGGIILMFFALLNEFAMRKTLGEANELSARNMNQVEISARNAEIIEAMGMMPALMQNWQEKNEEVLSRQTLASTRSGIIMSAAKTVRMILQIVVMGSGAYLVLHNSMTTGGIIACSILTGRALAPFEQAIGTWNGFSMARKSYERLKKAVEIAPKRSEGISLPTPKGILSVEKVLFAAPGTQKAIIKGLSFDLGAGESLGIIGPSAAGKSTLAKLIVGVWRPNSGVVRLDSADVYTWNREDFGKHVGYLPQDVELFDGTVRDNIARFKQDATDEEVVLAAQMAGAHEMILRLSEGYDTEAGAGGTNFSAGQRQRIGLARAFFGMPRLIVLDEPNSNLDDVGEAALMLALQNAKKHNITTITISHRVPVLSHVDKILVMRDGLIADFGPAKEVMEKLSQAALQMQQQQQQAKQQQIARQQQARQQQQQQQTGAAGQQQPGAQQKRPQQSQKQPEQGQDATPPAPQVEKPGDTPKGDKS